MSTAEAIITIVLAALLLPAVGLVIRRNDGRHG